MSSTLAANFPSTAPTMVSVVRLVSVSPFRLTKQMPLGIGLYTFEMQPQSRDTYEIMTVADTYQLIRTGFQELNDSNPTPGLAPAPIRAMDLANSLVAEWNRTMAPVGGKGVMILPQDVEEGSPAFKSILNQLSNEVRQLAEWAIRDASDKHNNGQSIYISDAFHRLLAEWMYGQKAVALPWYNLQTVETMKKCLACDESIAYNTKVCKSCGTDLVEYFVKYNLPDDVDPVVAAFVGRMKTPEPTKGTHTKPNVEPLVRVRVPDAPITSEIRAACVNVMDGEQKADMQTKKGQESRDEYIVSIIPDLCLRNPALREKLTALQYVIPNTD